MTDHRLSRIKLAAQQAAFGSSSNRTVAQFSPNRLPGDPVLTVPRNQVPSPLRPQVAQRAPPPQVSNPLANQNQPKMAMPSNTSRDAPKFDPEKPEELIRFFRLVEDLFTKNGITDFVDKKDYLGRYTDSQTEREWSAMDAYDNGPWETYKEEILRSYPEATDLQAGSMKALKRICSEYKRLGIHHLVELKAFRRKFKAECKRLTTIGAAGGDLILSNREQVAMVLGCLDDTFRNTVLNRLVSLPVVAGATARRSEDPYKIADVWDTAESIAAGPSGIMSTDVNTSQLAPRAPTLAVKAEMEELKSSIEASVAGMKDSFTVSNKSLMETLGRMNQNIENNTQVVQTALQNNSQRANNNYSSNNYGGGQPAAKPAYAPAPPRDDKCFYCQQRGHIMTMCPKRDAHLAEKKTILHEGQIRMFDGSWLPGGPKEIPLADRVEAAYAKKNPKSSNYAAHAQLYLGPEDEYDNSPSQSGSNDNMPYSAFTNKVHDTRDDMIGRMQDEIENLKRTIVDRQDKGPRFQENREDPADGPESHSTEGELRTLLMKLLDKKDQLVSTRGNPGQSNSDF